MATPLTDEVTRLLKAWTAGDEQALEKLTPLVYEQLHRVAQRCMAGERPGHTLQTTALVNEVYLRLVDCGQSQLAGSGAFLCRVRPADAAYSDRFCPLPRLPETRRWFGSGVPRRRSHGV